MSAEISELIVKTSDELRGEFQRLRLTDDERAVFTIGLINDLGY